MLSQQLLALLLFCLLWEKFLFQALFMGNFLSVSYLLMSKNFPEKSGNLYQYGSGNPENVEENPSKSIKNACSQKYTAKI